jgi:hypothetical protein
MKLVVICAAVYTNTWRVEKGRGNREREREKEKEKVHFQSSEELIRARTALKAKILLL